MFAKLMKYVFQWQSKRNNEKKPVSAQWQSLRTGPLTSEYSRQPTMMGRKGKLSAKRLIIFVSYLQKLGSVPSSNVLKESTKFNNQT